MARKALLVASSEFQDPAFENLAYPLADAERLAAVLRDPELCFFDEVQVLSNASLDGARRAIFSVTGRAARDDLVLLYFSGHGSLDKDGSLALVLPETESDLLAATALIADDLKRAFNLSRAAQKVLILDCCYAGAMGPDKMKSSAADSVAALAEAASGTFILTASTKFQPAFEKADLGGSVLTSCLVDGIAKGRAAPGAETVTLSALAAFVKAQAPTHGAQQPQFWDLGSTGELVFARRPLTFDDAWRAQVTPLIAQHHVDGHIEYELQEQIHAVIRAPTDESNRRAKELIEQLRRRKIGLARFGSAWTDLHTARPARGPSEPAPPATPPLSAIETPARFAPQDVLKNPPQSATTAAPRSADPPGASNEQAPVDLHDPTTRPPPTPAWRTLWARIEGEGLGRGPSRFLAPLLTTGGLIGFVFLMIDRGSSGERLGVPAIAASLFAALWLHLRLVSTPGAGAGLRGLAWAVASAVTLVAGFLTYLILTQGGPSKGWLPAFAIPSVLGGWLLVRMFTPARAGGQRTPSSS
jgi:hypothetical protein